MSHDGKTKKHLLAGEPLTGHFWPPDGGEPAPCLLRWTAEEGAYLDLIEPPVGWKGDLGGRGFTVHGVSSAGEELTLLDAWVTRVELGDRIARLHCPTVAVGALTLPEVRWPRAIYSTSNLSEWRAETGLHSRFERNGSATRLRVEVKRLPIEKIELPRASLSLEVRADTAVGYAPDWSVETWLDFAVNPKRKFTLDTAHRDYAQPLLSFTHFASDRPDSLTREVLLDPDSRSRIEVLRQGRLFEPRPWRPGPGNGYLFQSPDVPDLGRAIRRWWKLHLLVRPALGLFAEHIAAGNSYSPSRLLTLYTALERYAKVRHGGKGELHNLRAYGGVSEELTGCSNAALKLLGASRGYFAHANPPATKFTVAEIEDSALESTRRASALMQACLLRELGFAKKQREELMRLHYRNWLIP